jgi:pyruvate dehydrogenase E2 component (dihydrolipoamide acetyltransferase)
MAKILDMPKLSPTMEEGVLATWHKNEGDSVEVDDLLAEVETDKATMEFRAFDRGTLLKRLVTPGAMVRLGQPVAILGNAGEDIQALLDASSALPAPSSPAPAAPSAPSASPAPKAEAAAAPPPRPQATASAPSASPAGFVIERGSILTRTERDARPSSSRSTESTSAQGDRVLASPYVRKMARERGIDLSAAQGTGEHGRIMPADLDHVAAVERRSPSALVPTSVALATPALAAPEVRPLSQMRKAIARRLTQSKQTVPHFYLTIDVDAEALVLLREHINAELAASTKPSNSANGAAAKPEKVSLNDLIVKASALALTRVPETNAQFTDDAILIHQRVDISVAVAIPDGLVTPVVRDADRKSVVDIAREVRDLASRARGKKLRPEEMSDGTFSISNLGMFGIDEFAAVINPPEGAILAVGQVRDEPVVRDGEVRPGKRLGMTLSCDHRVVDGAVGAAFLAELRALIEHPMRILTG